MDNKAVTEIQIKMKTWTDAGIELAYNSGYEADKTDVYDDAYNQGLNDAWECARKIYKMTAEEVIAVFGGVSYWVDYSASEAIAKIKEYEEDKQTVNITALKAVCEDLSDARGSDFSGVIALENAIKVLEQMKEKQND